MNQAVELISEMLRNQRKYKENEFYKSLTEAIISSELNVDLSEHFLAHEIDTSWINNLEEAIIPLDNIIRTPRKFIKNEEDIVPIALARGITTDSVKHLAQHTSMIESVVDDMVTPSKILEIRKEESYETYENRFIYTLLNKVQYFLDKRMKILNDVGTGDNEYQLDYSGAFTYNKDKVRYSISINYTTPTRTDVENLDNLVKQNVSELSTIERIERIRKIFYDFQGSQFCKYMTGAAMIRPPLVKTNLLNKNPDYRAAVDLWQFIERYQGAGVALNIVDRKEKPSREVVESLVGLSAMEYSFLKNYTSGLAEEKVDNTVRNSVVIDQRIEQMINSYDFNISDVKRVFIDKIAKKERKLQAIEKRMASIIDEALVDEKSYSEIKKKAKKKENLKKFLEEKKKKQKLLLSYKEGI